MKRKQEPGRALAQGGVFLLVRLFSVRACAPFAKSEHKAFREKAPSEEKEFAMVLVRRGLLGISISVAVVIAMCFCDLIVVKV